MNTRENNPVHVKLISLGDVEVGKSCLIKRFCEGHFIPEYFINN